MGPKLSSMSEGFDTLTMLGQPQVAAVHESLEAWIASHRFAAC